MANQQKSLIRHKFEIIHSLIKEQGGTRKDENHKLVKNNCFYYYLT